MCQITTTYVRRVFHSISVICVKAEQASGVVAQTASYIFPGLLRTRLLNSSWSSIADTRLTG